MADASQKTSARSETSIDLELTGDFGPGNSAATAAHGSDSMSNLSLASAGASKRLLLLRRGIGDRSIGVPPVENANDDIKFATVDQPAGDGPRYKIGNKIASGGMGIVYEGWDSQLQRRIAIKIIRNRELAKPKGLLRFFREARIAARMQHPSILSIHEFDIDSDGRAFIVTGLLDGETLRTVLANDSLADKNSRQNELPSLLACFLKVCQAIAYAHSRGIIHRDLKPLNIMVGRYGVVTVLDWGLAKALSESGVMTDLLDNDWYPDIDSPDALADQTDASPDETGDAQCIVATRSGEMLGTPGYVSPEQARGEIDRIDKRSDVFSLGAILCEILTGQPLYLAQTAKKLQEQASAANLGEAFKRLDQCAAPPTLIELAKRCLSADPNDRPNDASGIVTAMTAYLDSGQMRA